MSGDWYDARQGDYAVPPMPPLPPAPPPAPPDGVRAVAVAVLNLSGLGLGYLLVRRRLLAAVCWAATAVLLLVALPADPDGVPGAVLVLYALFLLAVAAHGAVVGLRTRPAWPPRAPLALALGLVLLAAPAGGVVLYDSARDEAVEQMLLDRLGEADRLVTSNRGAHFESAQADYRKALTVYRDLQADHPGSRAAAEVPDRLITFYRTVGAPYDAGNYCDALAPLRYLRTVPKAMPGTDLGVLENWPDDRLATSLYECAAGALASGQTTWPDRFGELLTTFPDSEQAAKVAPAVTGAVGATEKGLRGNEPCTAVEKLKTLATRIDDVPAGQADIGDALDKDARRARAGADAGTYTCGVDQYKDGDFEDAQATMNTYATGHRGSGKAALAKKFAIAAEVAQTLPAAGKHVPTNRSGGSISVTVKNDSPDEITVLYTGPVTGSFTLKACGSCTVYPFGGTSLLGAEPCSDSGKKYPQRTIQLPVGTTYFVHRPKNDSTASAGSDTAKLESGYIYTECAYTTQGFGVTS
ncbi:hypothetical protein [Streptomyces sp. NPDC059378]|uniref:hypothetical protein n=1 Tax=Streptomyces sp. NPDC059378 TaxID=3346815 RepID=UPI0036C96673